VKTSKHAAFRLAGGLGWSGRRYRGQEQGLALVMTLFVVALVTILVLEYHFDAAVEIDLATNYASDVQAYHLALAGVRFAQALLQWDNRKADGPDDSWYKLGLVPACFAPQQLIELATTGGGEGLPTEGLDAKASTDRRIQEVSQGDVGCVSLRITDEDSKLPINALMPPKGDENKPPDSVWARIFQEFFGSFKIDQEVVEALADWMDQSDNPRGTGGAEKSYYTSLPVPYEPPNKRMRTPGELRLVKGLNDLETLAKLFPGVTPEAVADLDLGSNNYLTPFDAGQDTSGKSLARVNVNTAPAEVLKALILGGTGGTGGTGGLSGRSNVDAEVQDIIATRQDKQYSALPPSLGALKDYVGFQSTHFRVESVGVVGIVQKKIVAVLQRPSQPATPATPATPANQFIMRYFKVE